jgi:hypothetical protein
MKIVTSGCRSRSARMPAADAASSRKAIWWKSVSSMEET